MDKLDLEIYGPWYKPFWQEPYFYFIATALAASVTLLLFWLFLKKRKKVVQQKTPQEIVLAKLNELKAKNFDVQSSKQFYFELTSILKQYLTVQCDCDLMGKTDGETVGFLQTYNLSKKLVNSFKVIVDGALVIKFADQRAAQVQMDGDFLTAMEMVRSHDS